MSASVPHGFLSATCRRIRCALALRLLFALFASGVLIGCTTVGVPTSQQQAFDYGPPMQLRVCVLRTDGVSPERVDKLIAAVNSEFEAYGIEVVVPWVRPWERTSFTHATMVEDVVGRELEAPCDRLVGFVDRNVGDFLWGLVMPEVLGSVDDTTHTRGYVVATQASLNQLFSSPAKTAIHEFYHLLGCPHARAMTNCYSRIAALKRHTQHDADFFPGVSAHGRFLFTREEVNGELRLAVARR